MRKFSIMEFTEGGASGTTNIVARKELFKNKQEFLDYCNSEDCEELEYYHDGCCFDGEEKRVFTLDEVSEANVRFYPNMPEGFEIESGYTFCKKGKGAFEVYSLNV